MNTEKRDFDKDAATWDENPARVRAAKDVADAISKHVEITTDMDALDFGCGTGLLTILLQPLVRSIVGVDSSQGMIDVLRAKIDKLKLNNTKALLVDLDKGDTLPGSYNLVVSNMTLHHVRNIEPLFHRFYEVIGPSGYLCVADLDPDYGRFHGDNTGVFHFGFDRDALRKIFIETGFDNVRDVSAAQMVKVTASGETNHFTVFLMIGQRSSTNRG